MTWTYVEANLATSRKDQVRFMVGDTDTTDQQLQDEEITFQLTMYVPADEKPAWLAAAACCDAIAFKYAREVQNSVGPLSESAQQKYEHYVALAQSMRTLYATNGKGVINGSMAGVPVATPVLGGGGLTHLGTNAYRNPEGL